VSESFFGTLKTELDEPFATRAIAHAKLFDYIQVFYNRRNRSQLSQWSDLVSGHFPYVFKASYHIEVCPARTALHGDPN